MLPPVDTRSSREVAEEVNATYRMLFPCGDLSFVSKAFGWAEDFFTGRYPGYLPVDAHYHDFEHTLQGALCMTRLMRGRHRAGVHPVLTPRMFELGLLAILFHDTGYLKPVAEPDGTGAKYTAVHVQRSAAFAAKFLGEKGVDNDEIASVQNMIRCTGLNVDLKSIPFRWEWERLLGLVLATADYLGQMAADDYVDKLPVLYLEFAEAARYQGSKGGAPFASEDDLMRKTPAFWEKFVLPKLQGDFLGLYRFLCDPYPDGPNPYLLKIEQNISRLRRQLGMEAPVPT